MDKSVITNTEFTGKTLVSGTMPAHKEMAHDFFLSVTEENVLSAAGRIVNLLLRIIKIKKKKKYCKLTERKQIYLLANP